MNLNILLNKSSLLELKNFIKSDKLIFDHLIQYINELIIPNLHINIEDTNNIEVDILKENLITESQNIIINLSLLLNDYLQLYPNKYVGINLNNKWYSKDKIINNSINHFEDKKIISDILTIITKISDIINTYLLLQLKLNKNTIKYLYKKIENIDNSIIIIKYYEKIEELENKLNLIKNKLNLTYYIEKDIRNYYIELFDKNYLYLPVSVLNIFITSLKFISKDENLLNFIFKLNDWIPTNMRCIFLSKILKIFSKNEYINKIKNFNPKIKQLIIDLNSLYYKYIQEKNEEFLIDIINVNRFINLLINKNKNSSDISNCDKIFLISVEINIIKFLISIKNKNHNSAINNDIDICIDIIYNILMLDFSIINSYLCYFVPLQLIEMIDYTNKNIINIIYIFFNNNKFTLAYLGSVLEIDIIQKLKLKISIKYIDYILYYKNIFEKMSNHDEASDLIDPLISSIIIIPYYVPLNSLDDFNRKVIVDKYIIETYLWENNQNPFNKNSLTISELNNYNNNKNIFNDITNIKNILKKIKNEI